MIQLTDIHSLTDFLRNHKVHIERLRKAGRPEVLTVNGKAVLVVQDAESYQRLLDALGTPVSIEGVKRGFDDIGSPRPRPSREFID